MRSMRFTAWLVLLATLAPVVGQLDRGARGARRGRARDRHRRQAAAGAGHSRCRLYFGSLKKKIRLLNGRDWRILVAMGFTGGGIHLGLQWLGLHYTTATSGILYLSTSPIFILLMAAPLLGERIGLRAVGRAWPISFAGVATIAAQGEIARLAALSFNQGDLMALASMIDVGGLHRAAAPAARPARRRRADRHGVRASACSSWLPWLAIEQAPLAAEPGRHARHPLLGDLLAAPRLRRLELRRRRGSAPRAPA